MNHCSIDTLESLELSKNFGNDMKSIDSDNISRKSSTTILFIRKARHEDTNPIENYSHFLYYGKYRTLS